MLKFYLVFFVTGISFLSAAQTVTLTADRDNTIYAESNSTSNGAGDFIFAGTSGASNGGARRRALVHFDLSAIPTTATVTSATLVLNCNKTAANAGGVAAHKVNAAWGEGTSNANQNEGQGAAATTNDATWSHRLYPGTAWSTAGGAFVATASASQASVSTGQVSLSGTPLMADVQSFLTTPANNFGWILLGTETANSTALRFGSGEHADPDEQPKLIVTYTAGPVPVVLSNFAAKVLNGNAVLKWNTLTEINNSHFEIEHSKDGRQFNTIGKVAGNGNSTLMHEYTFTHKYIERGKHYYRLAQYNFDQTKTYSSVVVVTTSADKTIELYPNPAKVFISIKTSSLLNDVNYSIINTHGQVVQRGKIKNQQINIEGLSVGQYHLLIDAKDGTQLNSRFVKAN